MKPGIVRLNCNLSPELDAVLDALAQETCSSRAEVLRRAIMLFKVAHEAKKDGKKFGVAAAGQVLETEIVGL